MSATTFLRHRNYAGDTCKNEEFPAATFGKAFCIFRYLGVAKNNVEDVVQAKRKHLFVKKSDAETGFYYMGQFDVMDVKAAKKKDNTGKMRDIAKLRMKMHHAVREDLLRYLQSNIPTMEEKAQ